MPKSRFSYAHPGANRPALLAAVAARHDARTVPIAQPPLYLQTTAQASDTTKTEAATTTRVVVFDMA